LTRSADFWRKALFWLIAIFTLVRVYVATHTGIGVDEAHYVLYGTHLAWSYFDHPPLVGWIEYIFTSIFGLHVFAARLPAIFAGIAVALMLYRLLLILFNDPRLAFFGVLALHASFLFNALFLMLLPETLLLVLVFPILFTVIRLQKDPTATRQWIMLGIWLGLAGLAEYTAVFFVAALLLYVILKKRWNLVLNPKIFLTIFIAALLITPVLYWNIEHHWVSFTYQSNHVVIAKHIKLHTFVQSVTTQFGAYNPFLFILSFYALYKALRSENRDLFLLAMFGLTIILFFTYATLYKTALPHWSAIFYLFFIPVGTILFLQKSKAFVRYAKFAVIFGLIVSGVAYGELGTQLIPFPDYKSPLRDIKGWPTIMQKANALAKNDPKSAIAVTNWTLASRAMFYNLPYTSRVYLLHTGFNQFNLWQKGSPQGKNLIIINTHFFHKDIAHSMRCDKVILHQPFHIMAAGRKVNTVQLVTCKNYQGTR
jgi:4-amino-4-deoxy-L-arabinose transferase-like glycosyltransferase